MKIQAAPCAGRPMRSGGSRHDDANRNLSPAAALSLKAAVEAISERDGTSMNQFLVVAAAEKIIAMQTETFFAERAARAAFRRVLDRSGGEAPRADDVIARPVAKSPNSTLKPNTPAAWRAACRKQHGGTPWPGRSWLRNWRQDAARGVAKQEF